METIQSDTALTLSVTETAQRLRISRGAAYNAVTAGEIPSVRIGRRVLVPVAALERMLAGMVKA